MESILDELMNNIKWIEFYEYKSKKYMNKIYSDELHSYIIGEEYRNIAEKIVKDNYIFGYPKKSEISKARTGKKRVVYSYDYNEVDMYLQENLRYIITGKHNKKNYEKVPYIMLKEKGYRSLVHEYYEWIK